MSLLLVPSPLRSVGRATKRKLYGLLLVGLVFALLAFTVAVYQKALPWQSTVNVTLLAQRIGHQLIVPADVKVRGVIVGEVRQVSTKGDHAVLKLALEPDKVAQVPENVSARILPKTLFGEKFVALVIPRSPSPQHIKAGDVIPEDRSQTAIETQKVFDDLLPLLKTLKPVQLNLTLSAMAGALRGRGDALGQNFEKVDTYFRDLNPHLPTIRADISGLADLATNLGDAAPDLLHAARNFALNARTVAQKKDTFSTLLEGTKAFADDTAQLLQQNEDNLIALANVSRPTLGLMARYSPEFPCLLQGIVRIHPLLDSTFNPTPGRGPGLHIKLEVLPKQPEGYKWPKDRPTYDLHAGPDCRGLPGGPTSSVAAPPGLQSGASSSLGMGLAGSDADRAMVNLFAAPVMGVPSQDVPDLADLLAGPMMRGMAVSMS